ncbi:exodeoxyribonuclease VII small subunit [Gemella cuniculi]|uniref:exodeoxyribonuclease VII small subunit n=1 Tax=Gemella cuniculi TaxID=150240 RepID=UPI0004201531|nr:exodeoxyribonuclease VII small subunit [Gemella cuniculi]
MGKENFETNLVNLEKIVADLEAGNLSLEDSLEKYKQGIEIIKKCNNIIENAEKEVAKLAEDFNEDE